MWLTHTHLTALCPGLPGWSGTRKVKPVWILLKQETVNGSGINWAVCKSATRSRQITTPAPHHSVFLRAECPSYYPTNSVESTEGKLFYFSVNLNEFFTNHLLWEVQLGCYFCPMCNSACHILPPEISLIPPYVIRVLLIYGRSYCEPSVEITKV